MCHLCVEIDERIEGYRKVLRSTTEQAEAERINRLIIELYEERVRLHQNPEE